MAASKAAEAEGSAAADEIGTLERRLQAGPSELLLRTLCTPRAFSTLSILCTIRIILPRPLHRAPLAPHSAGRGRRGGRGDKRGRGDGGGGGAAAAAARRERGIRCRAVAPGGAAGRTGGQSSA